MDCPNKLKGVCVFPLPEAYLTLGKGSDRIGQQWMDGRRTIRDEALRLPSIQPRENKERGGGNVQHETKLNQEECLLTSIAESSRDRRRTNVPLAIHALDRGGSCPASVQTEGLISAMPWAAAWAWTSVRSWVPCARLSWRCCPIGGQTGVESDAL